MPKWRSLGLAVCLLAAAYRLASGDTADSTFATGNDDGPHVFWETDSTAVVIYACDGELDTTWHHVSDTLSFLGHCDDQDIPYAVPRKSPRPRASTYDGGSRFLVLSDIHGEYERFVEFLQGTGVVDAHLKWSWGDGHLIINGDVVDRGDRVTECLWLIYRLEQEAERVGGAVHFLLGNHELMVLRNDLRYVNQKYLDGIVRQSRIDYDDLFGRDMELGRWLRSKNTAEVVNGVLLVHGGMPFTCVERGLTIKMINDTVRSLIDVSSARESVDEFTRYLFGGSGPFWYRGYHYAQEDRYPLVGHGELDSTLAFYGVAAVIVGHTEVPNISRLFDGRVYAVDVPVEELGSFEGLLWQEGRFYRVSATGQSISLD